MLNAVININGDIFTPPEAIQLAKVSVFDRGYLYGDSLYEVIRSYHGRFYLLDEHLKRLEKSAEYCHMPLAQSNSLYRDEIKRTFQAFKALPENKSEEAYIRLIVSRGVGRIGFSLSCLTTPTQYTIIIQPVDAPSEDAFESGIKLKISDRIRNDPRALEPAMKSGNYLNSLLAYLEATSETARSPRSSTRSSEGRAPDRPQIHFDDAILCNAEGHVTEGTTFNIFYVKRGIVVTPPLDIGILDGISRRKLLEVAKRNRIRCREVRFPRERLLEADEVFITSSIREVFPVTRINTKIINKGRPGPITRQLHRLFQNEVSEFCDQDPS